MKQRIFAGFFLFVLTFLACGPKKNLDQQAIDGTWVPIHQEIGGEVLPKDGFKDQKLIIDGANYVLLAESMDKGNVSHTSTTLDIHSKEGVNQGKSFKAIYVLENNRLKVCYNLQGDHYPPDFNSNGKPYYFLSVFKRIK